MSCLFSEKGLDLDTAISILENIEDYVTINQPPVKPKGGEVFIFIPDSPHEQENYKCDQYRWLNSGPKEIPRKNPLVKKQYFIGKLPQGKTQAFQKHCYVLVGDNRLPYPVLLHYIGDETVMVDYPHGNSKKSNSAYFAIAPSVRRDIANRSKSAMPTAIINSYKTSPSSYSVNEAGEKDINPVLTPRNKSQVRNIRRKQKLSNVKDCIPKDDLATLHSLGSELIGFCHYIRTQPELACIVGLNDISTEVENLMKLNNNVVVFSFHETYKVGRYTITPFNFVHAAFSDLPTVPSYFMISETCDFFAYEKFLQIVIDCIPALEECHTAVVTNQEYTFTSAITVSFPNWLQIYDWEILFAAARAFLRKLHVDIKDISMRIKQLKSLMSSESIEDYRLELERLKKDWPLGFCEYYLQVLQEPVEMRLGRWILERYKLYSPHLGVLRGVNPDLQLVIKNLQELKDVSLDVILPSLYHLQVYVYVNIQKGFCGVGKYNLSSSFKFLRRDIDELVLPSKVYEPAGIVKIFRVRGITLFSESSDLCDDDNTSLLQAQRIVEMGHISHSTDLKAFLVKSTSGSLHGVQLFPRESCSCSINQRCAHIMAVMLALGMPVTYDKKGSIKMIKPQVITTPSAEYVMESVQPKHDGTNVSEKADSAVAEMLNVDEKAGEETAHILHDAATTVSDANTVFTTMADAYQQSQNIVQVNSADLESVLSASQGNEVLMVVADTSGGDQKSLITYEVAQEAMLAYAQAHNQSVNSAANVEIVGLQTADSFTHNEHQEHIENNIPVSQAITIAQSHDGVTSAEQTNFDGVHGKRIKLDGDIRPEELILTMSEVMHKTNNL